MPGHTLVIRITIDGIRIRISGHSSVEDSENPLLSRPHNKPRQNFFVGIQDGMYWRWIVQYIVEIHPQTNYKIF